MLASQLLSGKPELIITIQSDATIKDAVDLLVRHRIGAIVVSDDDGASTVGILSERDVVRSLSTDGESVLTRSVASLMTADISTCTTQTHVDELMEMMTQGRFRHVPVVEDGRLVGIVSIGDAVKARIDELATEKEQLAEYIRAG